MKIIKIRYLLFFMFIRNCVLLNLKMCRAPLGMQSGDIPDEALSASSSFDMNTLGPKFSRIRTEIGSGAWCPANQIQSGSYEYLEINLANLTVITMVETQGRFGNGQGREYTEYYMIEYKREDNKHWIRYRDRRGETIFNGNSNTYIAEIKEISPPIIAKRIRFIPYSKQKKTVCLRVEVYGCQFQDGLVWYRIPQGDRRSDVNFLDDTYDGTLEDNVLKDGIGQLFDGELGEDNYRADTHYYDMKGYEWIGWKRAHDMINSRKTGSKLANMINISSNNNASYIQLLFKFDRIRNFSSVSFHCNNMVSKDIQIFNKAIVQFSIDGRFMKNTILSSNNRINNNNDGLYDMSQLTYDVHPDIHNETARYIRLDLSHHIGRYLRIKLYFSSKWMLISEMEFNSSVVKLSTTKSDHREKTANDDSASSSLSTVYNDEHNDETDDINSLFDQLKQNHKLGNLDYIIQDEFLSNKAFSDMNKYLPADNVQALATSSSGTSPSTGVSSNGLMRLSDYLTSKQMYLMVAFIVAIVLFCAFVLILVVVFIVKRQRNKRKFKNVNRDNLSYSDGTLKVKLSSDMCSQYDQSKLLSNATLQKFCSSTNGKLETNTTSTSTSSSSSNSSSPSTNLTQSMLETYHFYQPYNEISISDNECKTYGNANFISTFALSNSLKKNKLKQNESEKQVLQPLIDEATHYASVDIYEDVKILCEPIQSICGNVSYYCTDKSGVVSLPCLGSNVTKYSGVNFGTLISDGHFGKISTVIPTTPNGSLLIAKILINVSNDPSVLCTFVDEVAIYSRISHPNLANMVGFCETPYCLLTESTVEGHLDEYLKSQNNTLNYSTQLLILSQICSAMRYLEKLNLVHRDLAIRNCLIYNTKSISEVATATLGKQSLLIHIKITDIAICLPQYRKDYYDYNNLKLLPIRYMPGETLFDGVFSSASDVWSFGVLLWQLFTNSLYLPYPNWSNGDYLNHLRISYFLESANSKFEKSQVSNHGFIPNIKVEENSISSLQKPIHTSLSAIRAPPVPSTPPPSQKTTITTIITPYRTLKPKTSTNESNQLINFNETSQSFIKNCTNMLMPANCTKEIYDLMVECCNTVPSKRPKFNDIDLFFQGKLFGQKGSMNFNII